MTATLPVPTQVDRPLVLETQLVIPLDVNAGLEEAKRLGIEGESALLVVEHVLLRHRRGLPGEARVLWASSFGEDLSVYDEVIAEALRRGRAHVVEVGAISQLRSAASDLDAARGVHEQALRRSVTSLLTLHTPYAEIMRLTGATTTQIGVIAREAMRKESAA